MSMEKPTTPETSETSDTSEMLDEARTSDASETSATSEICEEANAFYGAPVSPPANESATYSLEELQKIIGEIKSSIDMASIGQARKLLELRSNLMTLSAGMGPQRLAMPSRWCRCSSYSK